MNVLTDGTLCALMGIALLMCGNNSGSNADQIDETTRAVIESEIVASCEVISLGKAQCFEPGAMAQPLQEVSVRVNEVKKGAVNKKEIQVYYWITGTGPLEDRVNGCMQLSPKKVHVGSQLLITLRSDSGKLYIHYGGFWLDNPERRKKVEDALNEKR